LGRRHQGSSWGGSNLLSVLSFVMVGAMTGGVATSSACSTRDDEAFGYGCHHWLSCHQRPVCSAWGSVHDEVPASRVWGFVYFGTCITTWERVANEVCRRWQRNEVFGERYIGWVNDMTI
jgi:hypothetical protein